MKMKAFIVSLILIAQTSLLAQERRTENLIIITLDGFRWQEVFTGADSSLTFNKKYTKNISVADSFWHSSPAVRREKLLPFFWNVIGKEGQLYGNRHYNNQVNCANPYWFSYPGYSEMLTGRVDRKVASNGKFENPNSTVLEFIQSQKGYEGKIAAFSTWDVIPFVIRAKTTGIHTNTDEDFKCIESADKTATQLEGKRCDESTFYLAFEYLKTERPRVMFISFDGTDEHGHGGRYDEYLKFANQTDKMISMIWNWIQSQESYKNKTTLLITTDHGRGKGHRKSWTSHGRWAPGSSQMWFSVLGPDTPPMGEIKTKGQYYQKQVAKTAAAFLGFDYSKPKPVGELVSNAFYLPALLSSK